MQWQHLAPIQGRNSEENEAMTHEGRAHEAPSAEAIQARELREQAQEAQADGDYETAERLYRQVLLLHSDDLVARQKLAEICVRQRRFEQAIALYQSVVGGYIGQSQWLKAAAICRVILHLDPNHRETQNTLAQLYAKRRSSEGSSSLHIIHMPEAMTPALRLTPPSMPAVVLPTHAPSETTASSSHFSAPTKKSAKDIRGLRAEAIKHFDEPAPKTTTIASPVVLTPPAIAPPPVPMELLDDNFDVDLHDDQDTQKQSDDLDVVIGFSSVDDQEAIEINADNVEILSISNDHTQRIPVSTAHIDALDSLEDLEIVVGDPVSATAVLAAQAAQAQNKAVPPAASSFSAALSVLPALPADEPLQQGQTVQPTPSAPPRPLRIEGMGLNQIPIFSELPPAAFVSLLERLRLRRCRRGEVLIAEGAVADSMFILVEGSVAITRQHHEQQIELATLGEGAFFGEMALLSKTPRSATVTALEDGLLFEMSRNLVEDVSRHYPSVGQAIQRFCRGRLLQNVMRTSPIFAPFSADVKQELMLRFRQKTLPPQTTVIVRGRPGEGLFVVLSGRCEVVASGLGAMTDPQSHVGAHVGVAGHEIVLAELKDGDVFGEMSLLWQQETNATVRTVTECILLGLPKAEFQNLIMTHPQVLEVLARLSEERLQQNRALLGMGQIALEQAFDCEGIWL